MNVAITVVVFLVAGLWGAAVYGRLVRLRARVKEAWAKRDRDGYLKLAAAYNAALAAFPANLIGGLAGFKPAKPFE